MQERIVANLAKIQGLEMKAYTLEEQATNQEQQQQASLDPEFPMTPSEMVADLRQKVADLQAKDARISQLELELAEAAKRKPASDVTASSSSQLVGKLQRTVKSQKEMLKLKQQEISLLKEQLAAQENDLFAGEGGGDVS